MNPVDSICSKLASFRPGCQGLINFFTRKNIQVAQKTIASTRQLSSGKKATDRKVVLEPRPNKQESTIITFGKSKILVPSSRQKESWKQAMHELNRFHDASNTQKILISTQACVNKFYKSKLKNPISIENVQDVKNAFEYISQSLLIEGIKPIIIYSDDFSISGQKEPKYPESLCASVAMYFVKKDFKSQFFAKTVTEYYWSFMLKEQYAIPGLEREDDLKKMIEMIMPKIDANSVYHELGIGLGEGLLELLYQANLQGKFPQAIIGTDISPFPLEIFMILIQYGFNIDIDGLSIRQANASDPLDEKKFDFPLSRKLVIGANKFFSVLDSQSLNNVSKSLLEQLMPGDQLAAVITTNSQKNLDSANTFNVKKNPTRFALEPMKNGLGVFLMHLDPFKEQLEDGTLESREALMQDVIAETSLPREEVDISKVVHQAYYDPEKYRDYMTNLTREKAEMKFLQKEDVFQWGHDEKQIMLFEKN